MPAKILAFSGSSRKGSLNKKLLAIAVRELRAMGAAVTEIDLRDFNLPIYDGDIEARNGAPKNAVNLKRMIGTHHGILIVTPEYNSSVPALLKNAIDWVSRHEHSGSMPFWNKVYGMGSTSDGRVGGARALLDLRKVLATAVRGMVIAERVEISMAQHAFDESGELVDEVPREVLATVVKSLVDLAGQMAG